MQRKIFIGVSVNEKIKKFIWEKVNKINQSNQIPFNWVDPENYHLTLIYLGRISDTEILEIISNLKKTLKKTLAFDFFLENFQWGPSLEKPRMIWLRGPQNQDLINLREKIEKAVFLSSSNKKAFSPHITIARIRKKLSSFLAQEEMKNFLKDIRKFKISIAVNSIEIFESKSIGERKKIKYLILESIFLK